MKDNEIDSVKTGAALNPTERISRRHWIPKLGTTAAAVGAGAVALMPSEARAVADDTVNYLADLKTYAGSLTNGKTVDIKGYSSIGDQGAGQFMWSSSSTLAANDGTIVKHNNYGTGRWLRLFCGPLNGSWFGARGDGSADDTLALQRAIDASTGRTLMLSPGIYMVTHPLLVGDNRSIIGLGHTGHNENPAHWSSTGYIGGVIIRTASGFQPTADFDRDGVYEFTLSPPAVLASSNWKTDNSGGSYWHCSSIENISIDCAKTRDGNWIVTEKTDTVGVALHLMGEESFLHRVRVGNSKHCGFLLTGTHAVGTIQACSAWNNDAYGVKLGRHPQYGQSGFSVVSGSGGNVRFYGISGDANKYGLINIDGGGHTLSILGMKHESRVNTDDPAIRITNAYGTGSGGGRATILITGSSEGILNGTPGDAFIRIEGLVQRPAITAVNMRVSNWTHMLKDFSVDPNYPIIISNSDFGQVATPFGLWEYCLDANHGSRVGSGWLTTIAGSRVKFEGAIISGLRYSTGSTQYLTSSSQISAERNRAKLRGQSGPVTLSSTPSISTSGVLDGQLLILQGSWDSANPVTLQDRLTLGGSGLRLQAATRTLATAGQVLCLMYDESLTQWIELSFSAA